MRLLITFIFLLTVVFSRDEKDIKKFRKHYGLSYVDRCGNYFKTFTCLSACKSIGFQIFRMDHRCKCSCHEIKTSTILPFFKWGTNGTTRQWIETQSPQLYEVAGTLSLPPVSKKKSKNIDTSSEFDESDPNHDDSKTNKESFRNASKESEDTTPSYNNESEFNKKRYR